MEVYGVSNDLLGIIRMEREGVEKKGPSRRGVAQDAHARRMVS
jgi:hypothetical protein